MYFPIKATFKFAKCRQFKRFQSLVSGFPSFHVGSIVRCCSIIFQLPAFQVFRERRRSSVLDN
jgi:hypothetical protein